MMKPIPTTLLLTLSLSTAHAAETDFPKPINTQEETTELPCPRLVIKETQLPDGFHMNLAARDPEVQQPIAMAWDAKGRLWVAECYTYAMRGITFNMDLRDRIVIFEDTDQDGEFDNRKVFWDKGHRLTSIAIGHGGVWATCAPNLLFIPDRNGDDIPDTEPEIILDGWEGNPIKHNIVNGLKWGPDGWLYGRHGITSASNVGKPGTPEDGRTMLKCSIWRYHPVHKTFDVVCEGTTNPWGHDWDENGQLFFINTVIGHLWHAIPGSYFERMFGQHFNPYLYELLQQTADHYHWDQGAEHWADLKKKGMTGSTDAAGGGHAHCGMLIYQGDNWPEKYRGKVYTANLHGRRINVDRLERKGAGYTAKHEPDFVKIPDPWFRGIELSTGPDGAVYILDWSDIGECHENDGVHRTSGRIYRIYHGDNPKPRHGDLRKLPSEKLAQLQLDPNSWYADMARLILHERATANAKDLGKARKVLEESFETTCAIPTKLRALWALSLLGMDEGGYLKLLGHENEHIRAWGIRYLSDQGNPSPKAREAFAKLAKEDPSGIVQLYLASSLRHTDPAQVWEVATALSSRPEFAEDPVLPLLLWYGVEPAVKSNPAKALALVKATKMPKLRQFVPRRLSEK
jgi:putative membrane-bound dehydrogenase-like protein